MAHLSDNDIHSMAKERVDFKQHAIVYVAVNALLVGIWFVTGRSAGLAFSWATFWPVWSILGWGVGLVFHGYNAYRPKAAALAREEDRIRQKLP